MKYFALTVAASLLVSAQETRARTKFIDTPYDIKLNCGDCIAAGYNFVWKTKETGLMVTDEEYPVNTGLFASTDVMCCEGSSEFYKDYGFPGNSLPAVDDGLAKTSCALLFKQARNAERVNWR